MRLSRVESLDPPTREAFPINRLIFRIEAGVATAEEVADADRAIAAALTAFLGSGAEPAFSVAVIRAGAFARARAAVHRGEHPRAEEIVREHLASGEPSAELYALLANVLARRGALDEASAAREQALALAHPEEKLAAELAARAPRAPFR